MPGEYLPRDLTDSRRRAKGADPLTQLGKHGQPPALYHLGGGLADSAEHPSDTAGLIADRAIAEGEVALLGESGPLEGHRQVLEVGGSAASHDPLEHRADYVPRLGPGVAGGLPKRPWMLAGQHRDKAVVIQLNQVRAPEHEHREP